MLNKSGEKRCGESGSSFFFGFSENRLRVTRAEIFSMAARFASMRARMAAGIGA